METFSTLAGASRNVIVTLLEVTVFYVRDPQFCVVYIYMYSYLLSSPVHLRVHELLKLSLFSQAR